MTNEELVSLIQNHIDESENMNTLYNQNRGLIYETAKRFSSFEELEDLMQEAYFPLKKAVDSFNSNGDANFATYYLICLENHLFRYIDNNASLIRIPSGEKALIFKYRKMLEEYQKRFGSFPKNSDIAELLQVSQTKASKLRSEYRIQNIESLDKTTASEDGEEKCLIDVFSNTHNDFEDMEERIFQEQLSSVLWELVETLGDRQKLIIKMRFKENKSYDEIALSIGRGKERVRQILARSLRDLRKKDGAEQLKSFLKYDRAYSYGLQATGLNAFKKTHTSSVERAVFRAMTEDGEL